MGRVSAVRATINRFVDATIVTATTDAAIVTTTTDAAIVTATTDATTAATAYYTTTHATAERGRNTRSSGSAANKSSSR